MQRMIQGQVFRFLILLMMLCLLAACAPNSADGPLATEYSQQGTQMAYLRTTATVQAARIQTTLEFSRTQVAYVATQSQWLKATLEATGFSGEALDAFQSDVSEGRIVLPTSTPRPVNTAEAQRQMTQSVVSAANVTPGAATPAPDAPRLDNVVLSTALQNDCASGSATEFSTDTPEIYVVANGYNIPAGTKVATRWKISGQDVTYDFTTQGDTNGECLWFYIDQTDFAFEPGTWDVTWSLNGTPATSPITFVITEPGG